MYQVEVEVTGVAALMQHRFPVPEFGSTNGKRKSTGEKDYSQEWREYLYATASGEIYQPSSHFEGAMVKAATSFKVIGKRGKTYKDLFNANVFVDPPEILHGVHVPEELDADGDKPLYLDLRPVVVQRARVVRIRPTFKAGWKLGFTINVIDDEVNSEVVNDVLTLAGKAVGIGDYRPKFGRFMVTKFDVVK